MGEAYGSAATHESLNEQWVPNLPRRLRFVRIVTWNVNSIGARIDRVLTWVDANRPDVLALQELKCTSEAFPAAGFEELGYRVHAHGTGRWNGVALISRLPAEDVRRDLLDQPEFDGAIEPRAIGATFDGVRVWSVYVPNGREVGHDHFHYKLSWLDALARTVAAEAGDQPYAVIGDFNIAPTDDDVWDISVFDGATHVSPEERAKLGTLQEAGLREVVPRSLKGKNYTYWDYRQLAFQKGMGMRIDLLLANRAFHERVTDAWIDREERKGKGASDHAPVIVDLA